MKKYEYKIYFLLIVLLAISGSVCFLGNTIFLLILFPFLINDFYYKGYKFDNYAVFLLLAFFCVTICRLFLTNEPLNNLIYQLLLFLDVCIIAYIVYDDFVKYYSKLMVVVAIISLIFWGLIQVSESFHTYLISLAQQFPQFRNDYNYMLNSSNPAYSFYVYTVPIKPELSIRNCGPFYEPGLYVVYLILALTLGLFNKLFSFYSLSSIVLIFAIITTFSTTGYVALVVLLLSYFMFSRKIKFFVKIFLLLFLPSLLTYIFSLEFMTEKINRDMASIGNTQSRFFAMIYHWNLVSNSSLLLGYLGDNREISPNGISMVLVYWGVPATIIYYFFLIRGLFHLIVINNKMEMRVLLSKIVTIVVVLISVFSQVATIYPFFYMLIFMGCFNSHSIKRNCLYIK